MKKVIPGKPLMALGALALCLMFLAFGCIHVVNACYQYGDDQPTSQLIIDKLIKTTSMSDWQDNLPASQQVLNKDDILEFKIIVKNSGDTDLENINVKDFLPNYLNLIFNPGNYNSDNQEISWNIDHLNPGEEKSFNIRVQVDELVTSSSGNFCLINKAEAKTGDLYDQDTASFCLVTMGKEMPATGSSELILETALAGIITLAGIGLRKFGRGEI